jgi:corrinoid protein of di/trimethylamine methyltransferase
MADLDKLREAILNGDAKTSSAVAKQALEEGAEPLSLVTNYMVPAMDEVGRRFECEEYFVPELLLAARAMKAALEHIRPLLVASGAEPAGRVIIGTVKGDLHDIGKNLVSAMLEGAGFEVTDLGADVAPEKFIACIAEKKVDIVCLSALLTVTMPSMRNTIDALKQAGVREKVKILVGGAPVTQQFADQIGADGYGENASVAVQLARKLMAGGVAAQA